MRARLLAFWVYGALASWVGAGQVPAVGVQPQAPKVGLDLSTLRNPVWVSKDNLRDPSVFKTRDGYRIYYSRLSAEMSKAGDPQNWAIAEVRTRDFRHFEQDHDVSPKGHASPGDLVYWKGRYVLPYQTYPASPVRLCVSESMTLEEWTPPRVVLDEAAHLPWNTLTRVIDPSFVVEGDTLHCYFVGSANHDIADGKRVRANLMGHAITRDPLLASWEILSVDKPLIGWSDHAPDGVENTMVFRTGDHWTMVMSEGLAEQHLALATSTDLRTWNYQGAISLPRQKWMGRKYGAPFVWRDEGCWMMILMGEDLAKRTSFGLLKSADGKTWELLPEN